MRGRGRHHHHPGPLGPGPGFFGPGPAIGIWGAGSMHSIKYTYDTNFLQDDFAEEDHHLYLVVMVTIITIQVFPINCFCSAKMPCTF